MRPQAPQFATSVDVSMQTAPHIMRGALHDGAHEPMTQPSVAGQTLPQTPQWSESVRRSRSQPFAAMPSQSLYPLVQPTTAQDDAMHAGIAFGSEHAAPHALQCATDVESDVSQPFVPLPSQSPYPLWQFHAQIPELQYGVALAGAEHVRPHSPQSVTPSWRFVSQPFAATPSQSSYGDPHTNVQVDATHCAFALGRAGHTLSHAPQ